MGTEVGRAVGESVGEAVGAGVGSPVGTIDGDVVGAAETHCLLLLQLLPLQSVSCMQLSPCKHFGQ